jgi:hypothetical protein
MTLVGAWNARLVWRIISSMSKWTKTRRDPGRTYVDEEKVERKKRMLAKAHELLDYGTEEDVRAAAKAANPDITDQEMIEVLKRFRDAVSEREPHDRSRH